MKRSTFARLAVLLLVAGALALSGCGGGDGNGVDQSLHDMVTAERDAETIRADEAAALAEAEKLRADAEKMRADEAEKAPEVDSEVEKAAAAAMQAETNTRAPMIIAAMDETDTDAANMPTVKVARPAAGLKVSAEVGYTESDMMPPMIEGWGRQDPHAQQDSAHRYRCRLRLYEHRRADGEAVQRRLRHPCWADGRPDWQRGEGEVGPVSRCESRWGCNGYGNLYGRCTLV